MKPNDFYPFYEQRVPGIWDHYAYWLKVPRVEIIKLGIDRDISQKSRQWGKFVYLSDDWDAERWATAWRRRGYNVDHFLNYGFTRRNPRIRGFAPYAPVAAHDPPRNPEWRYAVQAPDGSRTERFRSENQYANPSPNNPDLCAFTYDEAALLAGSNGALKIVRFYELTEPPPALIQRFAFPDTLTAQL